MDLSIVVVSYKTPHLLKKCVESIYAFKEDLSIEVIIVDNDSGDESKQLVMTNFPDVNWIDSGYNAGFSRANNIGIKQAKGDYIVVLNPDSFVKEGFFKKYLNFYKEKDRNNKLGLLGCRIISSIDASLLVGSGVNFPGLYKYINANPIYIFLKRQFKRKDKKYLPKVMHYKNHEIDFVSGACVMIKKSKIIENNLFLDEDFFLYFEDVEWSYRVRDKGFFNYFYSEIEVYHVNSASTNNSPFKNYQIQISEYLYFYKVFSSAKYALWSILVRFNFLLNRVLIKKDKDPELWGSIQKEKKVFDTYFKKIKGEYKRAPSSASKFLKYVE
ncbi:MAG: glycosyltransferase family 2 protein [Chitinophagales bacterium]|nr:glycosyltransferase family 2 protein [Bacteroidota bacterium]MCB9257626.1 glycosyltransferase family 2 protein [Chitinophagales bacterium]